MNKKEIDTAVDICFENPEYEHWILGLKAIFDYQFRETRNEYLGLLNCEVMEQDKENVVLKCYTKEDIEHPWYWYYDTKTEIFFKFITSDGSIIQVEEE